MAFETSIITFVPKESQTEYLFRTLKNVDEQSYTTYKHFLFCETEELQKEVRSFFSLLSPRYSTHTHVTSYDQYPATLLEIEDSTYAAIHPVQDYWSPGFLDKMITELANCPVEVAGAWSQYLIADETVRGHIISTDKLVSGPEYAGLIPPLYESIKTAKYIQGLYYVEDIFSILESFTSYTHPARFGLLVCSEQDILGLSDSLATHHRTDQGELVNLSEQKVRNYAYRYYPSFFIEETSKETS